MATSQSAHCSSQPDAMETSLVSNRSGQISACRGAAASVTCPGCRLNMLHQHLPFLGGPGDELSLLPQPPTTRFMPHLRDIAVMGYTGKQHIPAHLVMAVTHLSLSMCITDSNMDASALLPRQQCASSRFTSAALQYNPALMIWHIVAWHKRLAVQTCTRLLLG